MEKSKSSSPEFNVRAFFKRFPDDEACLVHIFNVRYGARHVCRACGVEASFHRLTNRRAWACAACGDNLYPTAGTVFQDTRTPLQTWFYAIYLFVTTRHGVSGKELQRQLGVTYKTAWRIGQKIREQMANSDFAGLLSGHVEADETYVGGRQSGKRGRGTSNKTVVMGVKERGGATKAYVIPNAKTENLRKVINAEVRRAPTSPPTNGQDMAYSRAMATNMGQCVTLQKNGNALMLPPVSGSAPTELKASGACSRYRFGQRTSACRRSTCPSIWASSLSGRTIGRK
jgi:transposase